jgi:hypothetical protein
VLVPGRGYNLYLRNATGSPTITYSGPINVDDQVLTMTYTASAGDAEDGWNFMGNPYPCYIDWDETIGWSSKANIQGGIVYVWDPSKGSGGGYRTWNGSTGDFNDGVIAPGQAFLVKAIAGGNITINENAKTTNTKSFLREDNNVDALEILLVNTANQDTDNAFIQMFDDPEVSEALDKRDGYKLENAFFSLSTLSSDDRSLVVNSVGSLSCLSSVPMKITKIVNGNYTLSTTAFGAFDGRTVMLTDKFTNTTSDISGAPYTFSVTDDAASKAVDRFTLSVSELTIATDLPIEGANTFCGDGTYQVTVKGAEKGIQYFIDHDGEVISDTQIGSGSDLVFTVASSKLVKGENILSIKGENGCSTSAIGEPLLVSFDNLYEATAEAEAGCQGQSSIITGNGAPENGSYNWYESESATTPLATGAQFETGPLSKTTTYFVSALNTIGCEGTRQQVVVDVTNFDPVIVTESGGTLTTNYESGVQWYKDGELIPGATSSTFEPVESGQYAAEVVIGSCTTSATLDYLVTGIGEVNGEVVIAMYPNPVVDKVYIEASKDIKNVDLIDALGKTGQRISIQNGEGEVDFTQRASGTYFIRYNYKGNVRFVKFLKK